jgi:hypothetical protein
MRKSDEGGLDSAACMHVIDVHMQTLLHERVQKYCFDPDRLLSLQRSLLVHHIVH